MPFISNTEEQIRKMLQTIGVSSFKELLKNIPDELFVKNNLGLDAPLSEIEIAKKVTQLSKKNISTQENINFLGGGIYDHFIPAAVDYITSRPEFYSAYTPYQAEVSQGTLQFIYEFQTMICELTGMDAANASMYDGASAAAEALLMAKHYNRKKKFLIADTIHPLYKEVIKTYTSALDVEIVYIPQEDGQVNIEFIKDNIDKDVAAVLVQSPNFFGIIEDMKKIDPIVHKQRRTLLIAAVDPISLMLLNSPAEYNADIVVGEGQALGNHQNYGGPLFGFFASKKKFVRKMPGRIIGATHDTQDRRGYVMTLQTREQHIRRDKATSNICTNESLCALAATVYMVLLGKKGLRKVSEQCLQKSHYLFDKINNIDGFEPAFSTPFFKEFVVRSDFEVDLVLRNMFEKGYFAGIDLTPYGYDDHLLIAVTEKRTKVELDNFAKNLEEDTKKLYL